MGMRFRFSLICLVMAAFFLLGMGKLDQTEKPGEIPVPDQEVSVIITDIEGLTLNLTQFSINGQTYLNGKLGAGRVALPFGQIRIIVLSSETKGIIARVELVDRTQMNLHLEKGLMAYGRIKVGTYQILLDQLKKIEIQGITERKRGKDRI
ncbi:MAG: hypothetical protein A2Y79_03185 [Deltaproteobacteria bacterium RBG_13_43_22]|nr:MAG: hypothetical protein A2Y79_03185 [Deltaproteobacteria bacterium RBG_13_43_22]